MKPPTNRGIIVKRNSNSKEMAKMEGHQLAIYKQPSGAMTTRSFIDLVTCGARGLCKMLDSEDDFETFLDIYGKGGAESSTQ